MTPEEQTAKDASEKAVKASREADDAMQKAAKAAEAQALADQKAANEAALKVPVVIHGNAGSAFSIDGPGLGSNGTLFIGGRVIPHTRWDDRTVRGILPPGVKGVIRLQTDHGDRHGVFPTPPPPVVTTTTTVTKETAPAK